MVAQNKNFALANRLLRDIVIFAPIFPQIRLFDLFERILARFFAVQLAVFGIDCVSGEPDNPLDYPLMLRLVVNAVSLVRFDYDDIPVLGRNGRIDKQIVAGIQSRLHRGTHDLHAYEYLRKQDGEAEKNCEQDDKKSKGR